MTIFTFVEGGYGNQFQQAFFIELGFLPFRLAVVYYNYFVLLPKLLKTQRVGYYILATLMTLIVASFGHRLLVFNYLYIVLFPEWDQGSFWAIYQFLQSFMIIITPMVFIIGFTIGSRWISSERRAELLESEKLKVELNYLRSQINPHFFFNTLNSLYGLAQEKSDKTPDVVLKLSNLMNYILYDAENEMVGLDWEIEYIKTYISLEQIRYGDRFVADLEVVGNPQDFQIPPLIFLPFVENSFKHGINRDSDGAKLKIRFSLKDGSIDFEATNTLGSGKPASKNGGIGIFNVKRRLDLIYSNRYSLEYGIDGDVWRVHLLLKN